MVIERRSGGFRARVKKHGHLYRGPSRASEAEAVHDAEKITEVCQTGGPDDIEKVVAALQTSDVVGVQQRGRGYRAKIKHGRQTYVGPQRMSKVEAQEDVEKLLAAAAVSTSDVVQVHRELISLAQRQKKEGGDTFLDTLQVLMHAWLRRGGTGQLPRAESVLRTWIRRAEPGTAQFRGLEAARRLVDEYFAVEALVADVSAEWLREWPLELRLESGSRPRGTCGFAQPAGKTGLRNLGNTCYLNAIVQCLSSCEPLRLDLTDCEVHKGPLGQRLRDVLKQLHTGEWDYVAPFALVHQLYQTDPGAYVPGAPADCIECCSLLLDKCLNDKGLVMTGASGVAYCGELLPGALAEWEGIQLLRALPAGIGTQAVLLEEIIQLNCAGWREVDALILQLEHIPGAAINWSRVVVEAGTCMRVCLQLLRHAGQRVMDLRKICDVACCIVISSLVSGTCASVAFIAGRREQI